MRKKNGVSGNGSRTWRYWDCFNDYYRRKKNDVMQRVEDVGVEYTLHTSDSNNYTNETALDISDNVES